MAEPAEIAEKLGVFKLGEKGQDLIVRYWQAFINDPYLVLLITGLVITIIVIAVKQMLDVSEGRAQNFFFGFFAKSAFVLVAVFLLILVDSGDQLGVMFSK